MLKFTIYSICVTLVASAFLYQNNRIAQQSLESILTAHQISLLKDQVLDMEAQGTYDEGLADGLTRSATIGYRDGYHAAISQIEQQRLITEKE